jgi:hypothetical protein
MKKSTSVQYTLRAVPSEVDKALRRKARREGISLNRAALETLSTGLCLAGEPVLNRDLDFLAGTWVEDAEFDAALQEQDKIDPDLWR